MVLDEVVLRYPEADRDSSENLELGVVASLEQVEEVYERRRVRLIGRENVRTQ